MSNALAFIWDNWRRLAGIAGLAYIALFIVGLIVEGDVPDHTESASAIKAWFADNGDQYLVGSYLIGLSVLLLFLPFLAGLRSYLGLAEGGRQGWSRLAFAGGIIFILWTGAGSMFEGGAALAAEDLDEGAVKALAALDFHAFGSAPLVLAPFFLASAVVVLRSGLPWRVLGWLGLALAVLGAVAGAAPLDGDPDGALSVLGLVTLIGLLVWTGLLSIGMIVKAPPGEA